MHPIPIRIPVGTTIAQHQTAQHTRICLTHDVQMGLWLLSRCLGMRGRRGEMREHLEHSPQNGKYQTDTCCSLSNLFQDTPHHTPDSVNNDHNSKHNAASTDKRKTIHVRFNGN